MPLQSLLSRGLESDSYRIKRTGDLFPQTQFQLINGRIVTIDDNPVNYIEKGYSINDIVYSIVTLIMDKIKVAPWAVYTIEDEQALKAYYGIQRKKQWSARDFRAAKNFRHKALVPVKNPGKMGELLKFANEYESFPELVAYATAYRLLIGNNYLWADLIPGGANAGSPNELWNLPGQHVTIEATDKFPAKITKFRILSWLLTYEPKEIIHLKDWNPNYNAHGQNLYGMSRMRPGLKVLSRDNSSLDSSTSSFDNGGVSGILHMKNNVKDISGDLVLPEVQALKKTMVTEWTGTRNSGKIGLSGYDMGWIPIGRTAEEMQQIQNEVWNLRRLCNLFGVQSQLLNDPDNKTYNNQNEAEKSLTTRCALPALTSFRDNFNRKFHDSWGGRPGQLIDFDMTVYTELQEDVKEVLQWTSQLIAVSPNEQRELAGLESVDDEQLNQPWVMSMGRQPLEDFNMADVDNALEDDES